MRAMLNWAWSQVTHLPTWNEVRIILISTHMVTKSHTKVSFSKLAITVKQDLSKYILLDFTLT